MNKRYACKTLFLAGLLAALLSASCTVPELSPGAHATPTPARAYTSAPVQTATPPPSSPATLSPTPTPQPYANDGNLYIFGARGPYDGPYGCMDARGNIVIKPQYHSLNPIERPTDYNSGQSGGVTEYLAYCGAYETDKGDSQYVRELWGIIGTDGRVVTESQYSYIACHTERYAVAHASGSDTVVTIDLETGDEITRIRRKRYSSAYTYLYAGKLLLCLYEDNKIIVFADDGSIERTLEGYTVYAAYDGYGAYYDTGAPSLLAVRNTRTQKIGYLNADLEWVVEPLFDYVSLVGADGRFAASVNETYGYYDLNTGAWALEPAYDSTGPFKGALAQVGMLGESIDSYGNASKGMLYGVINDRYEAVIPCEYDDVRFIYGRVFAHRNERGTGGTVRSVTHVFDGQGRALYTLAYEDMYGWELEGNRYIYAAHTENWADGRRMSALCLVDTASGAEKNLDMAALTQRFGAFNIEYASMLPRDRLSLSVSRGSYNAGGAPYQRSVMVLDSDFNVLLEPWIYTDIEQLSMSERPVPTRDGPQLDTTSIFRAYGGRYAGSSPVYDYLDGDFGVMLSNVLSPQACDGYRVIGRRGFNFGMMDMQGNWLYSENIFDGYKQE